MTSFTVRVELHGAEHDGEAYDTLHKEMAKAGFWRTITVGNIRYHLPHAEYVTSSEASRKEIFASARLAANTTGLKAGIVVTESNGRLVGGLKPVKKKSG